MNRTLSRVGSFMAVSSIAALAAICTATPAMAATGSGDQPVNAFGQCLVAPSQSTVVNHGELSHLGTTTTPGTDAVTHEETRWKQDIPADDDALWNWLTTLDDASRMALLAHCVSYGVNALYERPNPHSGYGVTQHGLDRRMRDANRLARATGLDMVEAGWRPTVANYLGRVTKSRIVEAVREALGEEKAQLIDHLKKPEMAKEAERLLADAGWLPEPLRSADPDTSTTDASETDGDEALPARADRHRDHVALEFLFVADAGVETFGEDIDERVARRDLQGDTGILGEEGVDQRRQHLGGDDHRHVEP